MSKCTELGVTPISNSPINISNAISSIATNNYNSGRTQGQNDVKNNPNGYALYNKTQYDQNYNNGYNAGYSQGKSPVSINLNFISTEYSGNSGESYPRLTATYSLSGYSKLTLIISRSTIGSYTPPWNGSVVIDGSTIWSKNMDGNNTGYSVSNYGISGYNSLTLSFENRASASNGGTIYVTGTIS